MQSELKNQTLVAANLAKLDGYEATYNALIEVVRELESKEFTGFLQNPLRVPPQKLTQQDIHRLLTCSLQSRID